MILILIAIPADANFLNGDALNGSVLVGYMLKIRIGGICIGGIRLRFLLMHTFWMDTHWMDTHSMDTYWWDTCWTDTYWWDTYWWDTYCKTCWCKRFEWIRIAWIRTGGIRVERIRIGGIRIANLLMQTFWMHTHCMDTLNGHVLVGYVLVGYVLNGYVWDTCGVMDMCGICVVWDMCGICVVWDTPTIFWRTLRRNVFREKHHLRPTDRGSGPRTVPGENHRLLMGIFVPPRGYGTPSKWPEFMAYWGVILTGDPSSKVHPATEDQAGWPGGNLRFRVPGMFQRTTLLQLDPGPKPTNLWVRVTGEHLTITKKIWIHFLVNISSPNVLKPKQNPMFFAKT